jgi:hypothetical protein
LAGFFLSCGGLLQLAAILLVVGLLEKVNLRAWPVSVLVPRYRRHRSALTQVHIVVEVEGSLFGVPGGCDGLRLRRLLVLFLP